MEQWDRKAREFAAAFGEHMAVEHQASAMAGRVMGLLLISQPAERAIDELAAELQVSRGAISMATKDLLQLGIIEKTARPRDRRRYYCLKKNLWARLYIDQRANFSDHLEMAERGLDLLKGQPLEAKRPLIEMAAFFRFVSEQMPGFVARWEKESPNLISDLERRYAE
ncbi:MAG: MarR family transcriptional regulator [Candidatus Bipolaricaulis sp.]|nr:MarR family transcriptional regulator [Candidatus Bipolaricaulis sp.]